MDRLAHKRQTALRRVHRSRAKLSGTADRPRLSVHISNLNVTAQLIDDERGLTLAAATTTGRKLGGSLDTRAVQVGQEIADKAQAAKIKRVVFDRRSKAFHGRVKSLAEAARQAGLEF